MKSNNKLYESICELEGRETLSVEERMMLASNSTTRQMEAIVRGPIEIDIIERVVRDETLHRTVVLREAGSLEPLVWAKSRIHLQLLDPPVRNELVDGDIGIGTLLFERNIETHRDLSDVGLVHAERNDVSDFIPDEHRTLLFREYDISTATGKIMTIEEYFPKDAYRKFRDAND